MTAVLFEGGAEDEETERAGQGAEATVEGSCGCGRCRFG
jgi:hypothetical protein